MSPVRKHFWQLVARVNSSFTLPKKWSLKGFMPAGVNSTEGSQVGTSPSLRQRVQPLETKNSRYFSRSSSVFIRNQTRRSGQTFRNNPVMIAMRPKAGKDGCGHTVAAGWTNRGSAPQLQSRDRAGPTRDEES